MSEQFTHTDPNGTVYTLVDSVNTFFLEEAGFGLNDLQPISARVPYQHGAAAMGLYLPPRQFSLLIGIMHDTDAQWRAFDATLLGRLGPFKASVMPDIDDACIVTRTTGDGRVRAIRCFLVGYDTGSAQKNGPLFGKRLITYWAPDPFWYDPTAQESILAISGDGGIEFPITFPIEFPETTIDQRIYVANTGHVETWPTIRINGPGVDPEIENETTGLTLDLSADSGITLDSGDYIDIDMDAATIEWYDATDGSTTNIIQKMSAASSFWPLRVGDNTVHVQMAGAYSGSVVFSYYLRYLGA